MSAWLEKGEVIYRKALAVVFLVTGVAGVLSAFADLIRVSLDRLDSGSWHFVAFMPELALRALPHPTLLQQVIVWVTGTPQFVLTGLIGAALLRIGAYRWVEADLSKRSNRPRS